MLWNLTNEKRSEEDRVAPEHCDGRFVLHRHHDADGPHLDLRLEQDNFLLGWRIDASGLDEECWATEKRPQSI